jgi:HPt (histidine-containing phosphotransfer) domain-containing protein
MLRSDDLKELIEMARQLARSGARDSARQLLAELQKILDGLRMGLENSGSRRDLIEAHKLMQALRNLGQRQQGLLDQTFQQLRALRAERDRGESGDSAPGSKEGAAEQEALRRELGEQMLRLDSFVGGIPAPVGKAERAMRGAADALGDGRLGTALEKQTEAVDQLNQAVEAAGQAMARQLGGLSGMFANDPDEEGGEGGDIFGRTPEGGSRGLGVGQVKIPDRNELRRVQEILRELRRRAGERYRAPPELDYIERLLRRF